MKCAEKRERMEFVLKWAEYVKKSPDKDWSEQQRLLIDSQIKNAKNYPLKKEDYLSIKNSTKRR